MIACFFILLFLFSYFLFVCCLSVETDESGRLLSELTAQRHNQQSSAGQESVSRGLRNRHGCERHIRVALTREIESEVAEIFPAGIIVVRSAPQVLKNRAAAGQRCLRAEASLRTGEVNHILS